MRAIRNNSLLEDGEGLVVTDVPTPTPSAGELLVRVTVAAFTPADQMLCAGRYYFPRPAPFTPGLTGVGVVVAHNAGLYGRYLLGKRVFFAPGYERDGAWAEHALADANTVVPLSDLDDDRGAGLGNALTAIGLVATARSSGATAVVVNAAAGNLAGLIATRCAQVGMAFIGVVRSDSQAASLRASGQDHVLVSSQADFQEALLSRASELGARVLIDSLGGGASVSMMQALPKDSTALVIGHLSRQTMTLDALPLLLGRRLTVRAFGVSEWMAGLSFFRVLGAARAAQALARSNSRMGVAHRVGLDQLLNDYQRYVGSASEGRTLVLPYSQS